MESNEAIADSVGIILWEARLPDFAFTRISREVETLLGYPRARWMEPGFWASVMHPEDREDAVAFLLSQTMARQPHEFEFRLVAADGSILWMRDIVVAVEDGENGSRIVGLMINISSRRAEAIARCRANGVDLAEGWGQATLVRSLADQMRGPLEALLAGTDGSVSPPLAERARAVLGVIEAGVDRMPGDDTAPATCETVLVGNLVAEAAQAVGADIDPATIAVTDATFAAPVMLHAPSLRHILFLLMMNVLRHAEAGTRRIAIDPAGPHLRLRCGGDGAGQPPVAALPLALVAGQRRQRDQALILAHVAMLTEAMGGSLRMRVEPGRLAEVELLLPLNWADETTLDAPPRLRVLYAEDDVINAQVMSELLKLRGIETEIAINGRDAVEMFGEDEFDLVLMDIRMPLMDGIEATCRIRADETQQRRRRTPIIGVSAHAMAEDVTRCLAAGMDAHMAKPVRLEELTELIDRFVPQCRRA